MQANNQSIVDDHRNMLMISKNISEFQENNLKSWAFIFFNNVESVKVSWNFFRRNESKDFYPGKVDFDIKLKNTDKKVDSSNIQNGIDQLTACTKFLFWSETKVNIKINGKKWKINLPKESATSQKKSKQV